MRSPKSAANVAADATQVLQRRKAGAVYFRVPILEHSRRVMPPDPRVELISVSCRIVVVILAKERWDYADIRENILNRNELHYAVVIRQIKQNLRF